MSTNILHALSEKSFFHLWVGEVFTQISVNLFNFFLILVVFNQTHSNTAVSLVVLSFTVPAIIFGSIAGVLVDRWSKKQVLVLTNLARALLLIFLVFSLDNLVVVYIISFIVSALTQFFIPAESPMIPLVVHRKHLLSANALFGLGIFGSILIAYVLSGPLMLLIGPQNTLLVLAALLGIGAIFISFITPTYAKGKIKEKWRTRLTVLKDIVHTLKTISRIREVLHSVLLLALSQILNLIIATIAPGYASQILGIHVEEFPLLFVAPAALGMITGAVILVRFFHNHPRERIINFGIVLSGVAMLLMPYGSKVASRDFVQTLNIYLPHIFEITILHIMIVLAFILGVANAIVFVPANTIIQEKTKDEIRGKIYGMINTLAGALSLIPIILVGGLSDLVGVGWVLTGIGVSLLVLGIIRMVK